MRFDLDELEREAIERVGLEDFGAGDWRYALGVLLDAVEREARLTTIGRMLVRGLVVDRLVNRLEIHDWVAHYQAFWHDKLRALGKHLDTKARQAKKKKRKQ